MNKRRREGRGPVGKEVLDRYSTPMASRSYTYQAFKYAQNREYEYKLRTLGFDFEEEYYRD